jgi:hypothetical protein
LVIRWDTKAMLSKKKWAHEGPLLWKIRKKGKKASHVSNKIEREILSNIGAFYSNHFSHTYTSWSRIMTFFSLDPCFDFTIDTMQVCYLVSPYLSPISLIDVGWNKRRQSYAMPWWGILYLLSDLRVLLEE